MRQIDMQVSDIDLTRALVKSTRDLYEAMLQARSRTSALVLKDMGDAIYDAIPWSDLTLPVKQALVDITKELSNAQIAKVIDENQAKEEKETANSGRLAKRDTAVEERRRTYYPEGNSAVQEIKDRIEKEEDEKDARAIGTVSASNGENQETEVSKSD